MFGLTLDSPTASATAYTASRSMPILPPPQEAHWELVGSPGRARWWYQNSATGATSLEPPVPGLPDLPTAASVQSCLPSSPDQLPNGWESAHDAQHGRIYYFNRTTGETSWESPSFIARLSSPESRLEPLAPLGSSSPHSRAVAVPAPQLDAWDAHRAANGHQPLPLNWEPVWDEQNARYYYFNRVTGEAYWDLSYISS
eukprot:gnl/TRDRNA2_/TRDRNA2_132966_c1_seq1.p1 gnl/TRDRNA2_/TRDRNA2_132966_c1~~gnl/TRDRNA2_/TRDRNA2_132966_c1_seq1.p1  ORF type:complete len:199 (+),score=13.05 gnl/TRDRNA2_/TRDRNA2_132966_c1_seq1:110-706(+)